MQWTFLRVGIPAGCAMVLLMAGCMYGPVKDRSGFVSTRLLDSGQWIVFTHHEFAYRPAQGVAAFPDGGTPKYVRDVHRVGICGRDGKNLRILIKEKNREWCPGQGTFYVTDAKGRKVLLARGGQTRDLKGSRGRHYLLDTVSGRSEELDLKSDLARHGRDPGEIHLGDEEGTLVFITEAVTGEKNARRSGADNPVQMWVRTPTGDYRKVADSSHYHGIQNGEVIFWEQNTRLFRGYNIGTGAVRALPDFREPGWRDVTEGVTLSADKQSLELGVKQNDTWQHTRIPIDRF